MDIPQFVIDAVNKGGPFIGIIFAWLWWTLSRKHDALQGRCDGWQIKYTDYVEKTARENVTALVNATSAITLLTNALSVRTDGK